ncbi:hypothetical protein ACFLTA_08170 [Bacteroidota bacterium]
MKYIDTGKNGKTTESWSFLIEPEEMLADRLNMIALKNDKVNIQQTDTTWTNNMSIFQFMIGNADYSVRGRHNVKLLRFQDPMKSNLIPVPYDFDYCGPMHIMQYRVKPWGSVRSRNGIFWDHAGQRKITRMQSMNSCLKKKAYWIW